MPAKLYDSETVHVTIRVPASLMEKIEALAKSERRTKSQMAVFALELGVERLIRERECKTDSSFDQKQLPQ